MLSPRSHSPVRLDRAPVSDAGRRIPDEPRAFGPTAESISGQTQTDLRASIIIPMLDEAAHIAKVVQDLLADEMLVSPLVLVADGGSTDGSREIVSRIMARDPRVRLISNTKRLQSAGVNLAAQARGQDRPWLIRIDAHAEYPKRYASILIEEAVRTGAHSVVVAMEARGEGVFQRATAAAQNTRLGSGGAVHRIGAKAGWVDHGHHALFRREAFESLGGYDETFGCNEDAEFDIRLAQAGGRIWLTDRVRIIYRPRATPLALWRQYFGYGKGRARTLLKHRTRLRARQLAPLAIAPAVFALPLSPFAWPLAVPAALWAAVSLSYGAGLAFRARDPTICLSGVAAMIMHLAWSLGFWSQLGRSLTGLNLSVVRSAEAAR